MKFNLIFLTLSFFSSLAYANIKTEAFLSLSQSDLSGFMDYVSGNFSGKGLSFDARGLKLLEGLSLEKAKLDYNFNLNLKSKSLNALSADLDLETLKLNLFNFNLKNVTEIKFPGVNAKVITKMKCSELGVFVKGLSSNADAEFYLTKSSIKIDNPNLKFNMKSLDFQFDLSHCEQAPIAIDRILNQELLSYFRSHQGKSFLSDFLVKTLNEKLQTYYKNSILNGFNFKVLDRKIKLELIDVIHEQDRIEAFVEMDLDSEVNAGYRLLDVKFQNQKNNSNSRLKLPKDSLQALLPIVLKRIKLPFKLKRHQIPGIDFLFNNRLVQFFVWSDLLNFRKKSKFELDTKISFNKIKSSDRSLKSDLGFLIDSNYKMDMNFLGAKGRVLPYLDVYGRVKSYIGVDFLDQGLRLNIGASGMNGRAGWDANMKSWRKTKPSGLPWVKTILSRVKKALIGKSFDLTWESLGVLDYFKKFKVYKKEGDLVLDLELKNLKSLLN